MFHTKSWVVPYYCQGFKSQSCLLTDVVNCKCLKTILIFFICLLTQCSGFSLTREHQLIVCDLTRTSWQELCICGCSDAVCMLLSLVSSRLDYANSILYGIPAKHICRLQRTQNTLARVVTGTGFSDSSSSTLKRLHWLPIDARIKFKTATLTFKALNTGNPPYLASLLHRHNPCRALRSASANVLSVA